MRSRPGHSTHRKAPHTNNCDVEPGGPEEVLAQRLIVQLVGPHPRLDEENDAELSRAQASVLDDMAEFKTLGS